MRVEKSAILNNFASNCYSDKSEKLPRAVYIFSFVMFVRCRVNACRWYFGTSSRESHDGINFIEKRMYD